MKAALLRHAQERLKHEAPSRVSVWGLFFKLSASVVTLVLVFGGTAYAAQDSLPGEPLYVVKVRVLEEAIGLTYFEPSERIDYELSLMETRLDELKRLTADNATTSDAVLADVHTLINDRAEHITNVVSDSKEIGETKQIQALADLSAVVKAHEVVAETEPELRPIARSLRTTRTHTTDALRKQVTEFADTAPKEEVTDYMNEKIDAVTEDVSAIASSTDSTREETVQHLNDADEALVDGSVGDALMSVLEAERTLNVEGYVEDPS